MPVTSAAAESRSNATQRRLNVELFEARLNNLGHTGAVERARVCGVTRQTIHRWISGKVRPNLDQADVIAHLLGVTVDELLPRVES